jgi:hypothetical protein
VGVKEETQRRAVTLISTGIAALLSRQLADRFIDVPDERGVQDDVKEAMVKASFSLVSTVIASILVRRLLAGR